MILGMCGTASAQEGTPAIELFCSSQWERHKQTTKVPEDTFMRNCRETYYPPNSAAQPASPPPVVATTLPVLVAWERSAIEQAMKAAMPPNVDCRRNDQNNSSCQYRTGTLGLLFQFIPETPRTAVVMAQVTSNDPLEFDQNRPYVMKFLMSVSGIGWQNLEKCFREAATGLRINMNTPDRSVQCRTTSSMGTTVGFIAEVRAIERF
jgi:hypothetical protein